MCRSAIREASRSTARGLGINIVKELVECCAQHTNGVVKTQILRKRDAGDEEVESHEDAANVLFVRRREVFITTMQAAPAFRVDESRK